MKYFLLFLLTSFLILHDHVFGAAFMWCSMIALYHTGEESFGELWAYFGKLVDAKWLINIDQQLGFLLIAFPALLLQLVSGYMAFLHDGLAVFWLSLLLGARVGDSIFSHVIPTITNPLTNPGITSAVIYLVDSAIMALIWHVELLSNFHDSFLGFSIGAGFFMSVLPTLRLLRTAFADY